MNNLFISVPYLLKLKKIYVFDNVFEDIYPKACGLPQWLSGKECLLCRRHKMHIQPLGQEDPLEDGGHGNSLLYSWRKNIMDRGTSQGYSPWDHKESDLTNAAEHACTYSKAYQIKRQFITGYKMTLYAVTIIVSISSSCQGQSQCIHPEPWKLHFQMHNIFGSSATVILFEGHISQAYFPF